ncbi:hypothetical protein GJ631_06675 [Natronomonas sp. CBA1123]|uniref:DUF7344 domain-containing protein n=1 Tax=Natronomonas sp. CBA1123 TaxID=2668070 RepID=UPI0012EB0213|nr:hypothetical protein [Natronomonas sp. CBA1123]MUV86264.1 hypothetical protein [Natronomonas sp. CBA1123]
MSNDSSTLSQDAAFDLLSNARRRLALKYLLEQDTPVGIDELAAHVAAVENDTEIEQLDEKQRKRTYVSLYQTHIPKLAKAGVVEYDPDERTVALNGKLPTITSYLSSGDPSDEWPRYFLGVSIGGLVVHVLSVLLAPQFSAAVGMVIILLFTVLSLVYYRSSRRHIRPVVSRGAEQ